MPANRSRITGSELPQRAIIHQLLRDDHRERWSPKQLAHALSDIAPETITEAVARLEAGGVIHRLDELVGASRCTRYLDALSLISL